MTLKNDQTEGAVRDEDGSKQKQHKGVIGDRCVRYNDIQIQYAIVETNRRHSEFVIIRFDDPILLD
jgi:hypothetical protein